MRAKAKLLGLIETIVAVSLIAVPAAIGITTFSGMLAATLVGIILTPALFVIFQNLRNTLKRRFTERFRLKEMV